MPSTSPSVSEQRDGQQLPHVELAQHLQVGPGNFAGLVGPEDFLVEQGLAGGPGGKHEIHLPGLTVFRRPAHVEGAVFQQSNEAASEAQEVRGAQRKLLQKLIQLADGAQFGRDIQQLMKFVGLGPGRGVKLGIGDGHRGKTGDH